jgi:hypothetical protein
MTSAVPHCSGDQHVQPTSEWVGLVDGALAIPHPATRLEHRRNLRGHGTIIHISLIRKLIATLSKPVCSLVWPANCGISKAVGHAACVRRSVTNITPNVRLARRSLSLVMDMDLSLIVWTEELRKSWFFKA